MQRISYQLFLSIGLIVFVACSNKNTTKTEDSSTEVQVQKELPIEVGQETSLLLADLAANGDYVNSKNFPSLIKAQTVFDELNSNNLVIDIRSKDEYNAGHISNAVNKNFSELPDYFVSEIKPFEYKRIVLVSTDGQTASYATCLLRLMGYGNTYALRWGMSSWNSQLAKQGWLNGCGSEFQNQLEVTINNEPAGNKLPELNTGKTTGEEIGAERFKQLFAEGLSNVMIDATSVFSEPTHYFVMNYDRKDKYESGHIPGALRYKPGGTLSFVDEMATLPINKPIVVYCGTGHNSGFVTAYLRLFGYDARTLSYGNNSFMYDRMVADRSTLSWLPFTTDDFHDFELVK